MNKLTDKKFVLCLDNNEKLYLTEEQANRVKEAVLRDSEFILIARELIRKRSIKYIISAQQVEKAERVKRGEWMCKYGFWHQRGEQCGHGLMKNSTLKKE